MAQFEKGHPKSGGRPKGGANKVTASLREAILIAGENVGRDKKGLRGLIGYCEFLAVSHPEVFASLLGRVLPMTATITTQSAASETLSLEEMEQRLKERGLPLAYDRPMEISELPQRGGIKH